MRVVQLADVVNRHDFIDVIVDHLDADAFDVRVATFGVPSNIADPGFAGRGVETINIHAEVGRRSYPGALFRLRSYLTRERIDVVHCHHFDPALLAWMATRLAPTRLVVGRHYSDAIHLSASGARRSAYLALERRVHRAAAAVVVPSRMIADMVSAIGVRPERVHVIPYAFTAAKYAGAGSTDRVQLHTSLALPADAFVIGTFARLYRDKGHRYLLRAVRVLADELPSLRWVIVGDGAERAGLERSVAELDLHEVVRFTGWRRDAMAMMECVDVVVQPTLQEAFSSVMGEAMWLRRPLVITDVSGATDIIDDNVNGVLVPKRDPEALADAIRTLALDRGLASRLGAAGHAFVTTELTPERVVPQYGRVYERALAD
ncbi:MAG: glycosyltransferase family 4 protein [Acidimicrobiia bacterium]|nr:glycosyltransferase family 4 protein [Acidimicrobiia bacterium]